MPLEIPIRYYDRDSNKVTIVDDAHENVAPPLATLPCDCDLLYPVVETPTGEAVHFLDTDPFPVEDPP